MCMVFIGCLRVCVNECTYTPTRSLQVTVYRSCDSKNIFVFRPYIWFFCFKWKAKKAKLGCSSIVTIVRPATRIGWWKVKDGDEVHEIQYMCGICSDPLWFCNTHTHRQPHFPSCHNMGRGGGRGRWREGEKNWMPRGYVSWAQLWKASGVVIKRRAKEDFFHHKLFASLSFMSFTRADLHAEFTSTFALICGDHQRRSSKNNIMLSSISPSLSSSSSSSYLIF